MKILDIIAAYHNWFLDKDFIWWPFSFLRPEPKFPITFKNTILMTGCFGGLTFIFFSVFALMNSALTANYLLLTFFSCFLGFFIWFNAITRPLWNYRAKKLTLK